VRNFWLILSVLWLWTCSGGGIETSFLMVIKTDANGTRIWQKRHSIDGNTFGNSVVEVSPGVYAITGNTNGSNRKAYLLQLQE
jgi:hypothetical protein|tara:strand:+ start:1378 stop:1626 length:249 start_codon:yes stop_codon:yes gene_type:complete